MTMSDPIADMLTRIRNANTAKHDTVDVPSSKMKLAIAQILLDEGYIKKYDILDDGAFKTIHITLKYGEDKNHKIITGLKENFQTRPPRIRRQGRTSQGTGRTWYCYHLYQPGRYHRQESKRTSGRRRGTGIRLVINRMLGWL